MKYCSSRCRYRAKSRKRQSESPRATELSRQRQRNADLMERIRKLEGKLEHRLDQVQEWKQLAKAHERRYRRVKKDVHRARRTVGEELVRVREELSRRQSSQRSNGPELQGVDPSVVTKLRREKQQLETELVRVYQHVQEMRKERDKHREQLATIHQDNMRFEDVLRRFTMKSQLMFRVFREWDLVLGWLYEWTGGRGRTREEHAVLSFWIWMHDKHPSLIEKGRIDTTFDEELHQIELDERLDD